MDQAFAAIWKALRADDPFRDYARDSELRFAIGKKLWTWRRTERTTLFGFVSSPWTAYFFLITEKRIDFP